MNLIKMTQEKYIHPINRMIIWNKALLVILQQTTSFLLPYLSQYRKSMAGISSIIVVVMLAMTTMVLSDDHPRTKFGKRDKDDTMLHRKVLDVSRPLFPGHRLWASDYYGNQLDVINNITYVEVIHWEAGGRVEIIDGGVGFGHVSLNCESAKGSRLGMTVEVYGYLERVNLFGLWDKLNKVLG